jgi:predicted Zn-dependent protease
VSAGGRATAGTARGGLALVVALALGGCAIGAGSPGPSPEPSAPSPGRAGTSTGRPVDAAHAQRLQRIMVPLIRAMDNPIPLDQVKIGVIDSDTINAASGGGGQFFVTRGLLEKANDRHLTGVLAHEIAHDDLRHVARAQALGVGLNIGMIILDQIIPGSGAVTPIAGELIARGYSRNEEYSADQHGVKILERAGQSREVMIDTLNWLIQTSGGGKGGFFSTHPATADRVEALRRLR